MQGTSAPLQLKGAGYNVRKRGKVAVKKFWGILLASPAVKLSERPRAFFIELRQGGDLTSGFFKHELISELWPLHRVGPLNFEEQYSPRFASRVHITCPDGV